MKKQQYIRPQVYYDIIYLESSIVAASTGARINPGNPQNNQPQVQDWETPSGFSNDLDL